MQSHAVMPRQATWGRDMIDAAVAGEGLVHKTSQECQAWCDKQKLQRQQRKEAAGMERKPSVLVSATPKPSHFLDCILLANECQGQSGAVRGMDPPAISCLNVHQCLS